jgi:hypothetical protein
MAVAFEILDGSTVIASEAKQSMPQQSKSGLLRRSAPRNDERRIW